MAKAKYTPMPLFNEEQAARFWSRVEKRGEDECWEWKAGRIPQGYGMFHPYVNPLRSHRVSYYLSTGVDPKENLVLHSCDNPPCCNPKHLSIGSNMENSMDMMKKRRGLKGVPKKNYVFPSNQKPKTRKFDVLKVIEVRRLRSQGVQLSVIAKMFNASRAQVGRIVYGYSWAHVPGYIKEW